MFNTTSIRGNSTSSSTTGSKAVAPPATLLKCLDKEPDISDIGRRAWKTASRVARQMSKESSIVNPIMEKCIPRFHKEEIVLGKLLGKGGFNHVYDVKAIVLDEITRAGSKEKSRSRLQRETRAIVQRSAAECKTPRFACKFLSAESMKNSDRFRTGAADLVVEAKFLASLDHPNIIKLKGMGAAGTFGFSSGQEMGYFLILDKLQGTLEMQIECWQEEEQQRKKREEQQLREQEPLETSHFFLLDRLDVASDVSDALSFLHERNIIFRDLKPDNIGFDMDGNVQLFDFGLAKELDPRRKVETGGYEMSGNTGSRRYMAPEVALDQPYDLSADVYGFGLLVWQTLSLQVPFNGMTKQVHHERVVQGGERPPMYDIWGVPLKLMMMRCWEYEAAFRPDIANCSKNIKTAIVNLEISERKSQGLPPPQDRAFAHCDSNNSPEVEAAKQPHLDAALAA